MAVERRRGGGGGEDQRAFHAIVSFQTATNRLAAPSLPDWSARNALASPHVNASETSRFGARNVALRGDA